MIDHSFGALKYKDRDKYLKSSKPPGDIVLMTQI